MLHLILFYYFSIILVYFMMIILFYSTYYHCRYFILDISEVHCIIIDIEIINSNTEKPSKAETRKWGLRNK